MELGIEKFNYSFDEKLIAKYPLKNRDESRLLAVDIKNFKIEHKKFYNIIDYINPSDVIVVNNSYVKKARIYGKRYSGGKVEILIIDFPALISFPLKLKSLIKSHKKIRENEKIIVMPYENNKSCLIATDKYYGEGEWDIIINSEEDYNHIFNNCATVPLPSYIKRPVDKNDEIFYQTIYANENSGFSVAAPTAGLHFSDALIKNIKTKGGIFTDISLNIGLGTFMPVREKDITKHIMHKERYKIHEETAKIINNASKNNNRIIITGTSSVRCLESSADAYGVLHPHDEKATSLYIYPGYKFKITRNLITNFHQPKSSLFIMISALIGLDATKVIYEEAIKNNYSLFSYGDAMYLYNI
jgi:S-adenosylmethionine:tRNA ribosyltransferase-isomerase